MGVGTDQFPGYGQTQPVTLGVNGMFVCRGIRLSHQ